MSFYLNFYFFFILILPNFIQIESEENLDKSAIYPRVCMTAQRCSLEQGGAGAGWAGQPPEALRLGDPSGAGDRCGYLDG